MTTDHAHTPADPATLTCTVDGHRVVAPEGATVAAALTLAQERTAWRATRFHDSPRGLFCGIGVCFDCLVSIDGSGPLRSCLVEVTDGMTVTTNLPPAGGATDGGPV